MNEYKANWLLFSILLFFGILFSLILVINHYYFRTYCYDYAWFSNSLWEYAHFKIVGSPFSNPPQTHPFQDHVSLTLMVLSPLYWLFNWLFGSYILIYIEIIFILAGAYGTYKYIQLHTKNNWLSIGSLVYYFVLLGRFTALTSDFIPTILAASVLPLFFLFIEKRKFIYAFIIYLFILTAKENMPLWLIFISFTLFFVFSKDKKIVRFNILLLIISLAYFVFIFSYLIPKYAGSDQRFAYSALGDTATKALFFIVSHPFETFKMLFQNHLADHAYDSTKMEFYIIYLISGGFVLFYRPQFLIMFIPIIGQKMFNDFPVRWGIDGFYSIEVVSMLPITVFWVINKLKNGYIRQILTFLVPLITIITTFYIIDHISYLGAPGNKIKFYKPSFYQSDIDIGKINNILKEIPDNKAIAVTQNIAAHLAQRDKIYCLPDVRDAESIIFLLSGNVYPMNLSEANSLANFYLANNNWTLSKYDFPVIIFDRLKQNQVKQTLKTKLLWKDSCNMESYDPVNRVFLAKKPWLRLKSTLSPDTTIYRSGKQSLKLNKNNTIGLSIILDSAHVGKSYRIFIWRFAKTGFSELVVSDITDIGFKTVSDKVVQKDSSGWEQMSLEFMIPNKLTNNQLSIYIWNREGEDTYFDDFSIEVSSKSITQD